VFLLARQQLRLCGCVNFRLVGIIAKVHHDIIYENDQQDATV